MSGKIDRRKFNRGHKGVSGRKPKSEEIKIIERLTPLEQTAFLKLQEGIASGDFKFIKLFYEYFYGKPKETKDVRVFQEQPIFSIDYDEVSEEAVIDDDNIDNIINDI